MTGCISQIDPQMSELKATLQPIPVFSSSVVILRTQYLQTNASSKLSARPASYSAIISGNLSDIVKSAVDISILEHEANERDRASVASHNLSNHSNDVSDVRELFDYLECNIHLVNVSYFVRFGKSSKKPHILKVESASSSDRDILLLFVKYLKVYIYNAVVAAGRVHQAQECTKFLLNAQPKFILNKER